MLRKYFQYEKKGYTRTSQASDSERATCQAIHPSPLDICGQILQKKSLTKMIQKIEDSTYKAYGNSIFDT
jgi:hypothetical protein